MPGSVEGSFGDALAAASVADGLRKGERTRLRLLAATADLLQTTFFHSLRVSDICARARVSQGTFYLYFTDKADIVASLLSDFAATVFDALDEASAGAGDAHAAIHAPTLAYVRIFRFNRGLLRCLTQMTEESGEFERIYRDLNAGWNRRAARAIEARLGEVGAAETALAMAYALSSMVDEFLANLYVREDPRLAFLADRPDEAAAILSRLWYRAVYLTEPAAAEPVTVS